MARNSQDRTPVRATGAYPFTTDMQIERSSATPRVNFAADIPIEPALLIQSGYYPQAAYKDAEQTATDSSDADLGEQSDASPGSTHEGLMESEAAMDPPAPDDAPDSQDRPHGGGRGRPRGRPRGRGRGSALTARAERNPLHVRERAVPKGSKPRGSKKGVKKGPRKPLEPSDEFKALNSRATFEYMSQNFEKAKELVEQAISLNPEIFSAYALLSSIYQHTGDDEKAVAVLFQGAHTTPRNIETWNSVARSILDLAKDRRTALPDAVYCYNRVLTTNRDDFEARTNRADLNMELGRYVKAIHDFKHLLRLFPHNIDYLRSLSECCSLMGNPFEAISYYDMTIEYYRAHDDEQGPPFFWSDVNIYAELYWMAQNYQEGLIKLKQLARWMLGRGSQSFWDDYNDDREFDADDARRLEVIVFDRGHYDINSYGNDLPMQLRIKLGLFRYKLDQQLNGEAMRHFSWLESAVSGNEDSVYDYADLIREIATTLKGDGFYEQAANYFKWLTDVLDPPEARLYIDLGQCYRYLERYSESLQCFRDAAEADHDDLKGPEELIKLFDTLGDHLQATTARSEYALRRRKKVLSQRQQLTSATANDDPDVPVVSIEDIGENEDLFNARMLTRTPKKATETVRFGEPSSAAKNRFREHDLPLRDLVPLFQKLKELDAAFESDHKTLQAEWMAMAKEAITHLQAYRPFWPADRPRSFSGYNKLVREKAAMSKSAQDENSGNNPALSKPVAGAPDSYCGVQFSDWLACLLRYVLRLTAGGAGLSFCDEAYAICKSMASCSIWHGDNEAHFLIHLAWLMCALQGKDHETLCEVSRFFTKQYQFVTDSYRMYAALNRFCNLGNKWYNMSPSQKYMLRQVKSMDFCLMQGSGKSSSIYDERAQLSAKDGHGEFIVAKETDVALLVLYGHMLFATTSYAYGMHYFYRAHMVEPDNPMVLLSLALGYTHHATKRQAENRQALISCGLSFLFKYYDVRKTDPNPLHRQEADYNVGRTFHFLGLLGLATPYYEQCLALSREIQELAEEEREQDFAREAAYALRGFHAQAGRLTSAREITERWLML